MVVSLFIGPWGASDTSRAAANCVSDHILYHATAKINPFWGKMPGTGCGLETNRPHADFAWGALSGVRIKHKSEPPPAGVRFGFVVGGAAGGIRTLGPLLTVTRFPVVLVMTTSILLRVDITAIERQRIYYTSFFPFVKC